jgi:hypothetical protein
MREAARVGQRALPGARDGSIAAVPSVVVRTRARLSWPISLRLWLLPLPLWSSLVCLPSTSFAAGDGAGNTAADAEKPGDAVPPAAIWPIAVVDRPLTLRRGMAVGSLGSQSYWSPSIRQRSYFGPSASLALHDRVQLSGGLPFAFCWDAGSHTCNGSSTLDRAYLDLGFALRRSPGLSLAAGVASSIERWRQPSEHRSAVWFIGKRTWWHRLSLLGIARLEIGWDHTVQVPVTPNDPPVRQNNQTRIFWTEEVVWQVVERVTLFAYGNPYRPLGAPGDESWATRVGGGASLALGQRWQAGVECDVENVMPLRQWQYVPYGKGCFASVSVFRLPE